MIGQSFVFLVLAGRFHLAQKELILNFFFFFCLFRAVPTTYGSYQVRGRIGAAAAGLGHSYSNSGSELPL